MCHCAALVSSARDWLVGDQRADQYLPEERVQQRGHPEAPPPALQRPDVRIAAHTAALREYTTVTHIQAQCGPVTHTKNDHFIPCASCSDFLL